MNRGADSQKSKQGGYTIVEVMIFLAVSAMLFATTMFMLAGRQQKAQFDSVVRNFETKLTDVANDVAHGYYQSTSGVGCNAAGNITTSGSPQGENEACIFLGRLVKFGSGGDREGYGVYSIIGNREVSPNVDVSTLTQANPRLLWTGNGVLNDGLREQEQLGFGTRISCIEVGTDAADGCSPSDDARNAGIAFITKVTGTVEGSDATGAGIRAELNVYRSMLASEAPAAFRTKVNATSATDSAVICLHSGSTNQYALIYLGSQGSSGLTVKSVIHKGDSCDA